jgi:hypothetical protein
MASRPRKKPIDQRRVKRFLLRVIRGSITHERLSDWARKLLADMEH